MITFDCNKKLTVINLLGGPGAGKSTTAHFLAGHMKVRGMKVEYVHEFAKSCVWDKRSDDTGGIFTEQDYITGNQHQMIRRLVEHDIDYVILDTSLLLGLIYAPYWYPKSYKQFLLDIYNSYNNVVVYLDRGDIPYVQDGRNQSYAEAQVKDSESKKLLTDLGITYYYVHQQLNEAPDKAALDILEIIQHLK